MACGSLSSDGQGSKSNAKIFQFTDECQPVTIPVSMIRVTRIPAPPKLHLRHDHFRKAFLGLPTAFIPNKSRTLQDEPRIHQITLTVNLHPFELSQPPRSISPVLEP